jgi:hypothetical protein
MFRAFSRPSSGAQWLQWQPLVLPSYRGDGRAVFVVGPTGPTTNTACNPPFVICDRHRFNCPVPLPICSPHLSHTSNHFRKFPWLHPDNGGNKPDRKFCLYFFFSLFLYQGTTATHRGTTATHRGPTATHRGTTATHRGTTATHRGTTATHRCPTATHRGTTATHRGPTATHRGPTATHRGTTATHRGTTATQRHNSHTQRHNSHSQRHNSHSQMPNSHSQPLTATHS